MQSYTDLCVTVQLYSLCLLPLGWVMVGDKQQKNANTFADTAKATARLTTIGSGYIFLFVVRSAHTLLSTFVFVLMLVDQTRLLFLVHTFCLVQFAEQIV